MYLLRTERPVLLPREVETHAWYEANRPWERFGLTHILDREPGDWRHYSVAFHAAWRRAREEGTGFINAESDVVPTLEAFRQVLECPERVCSVPYVIYGYNDGIPVGHSATIETKIPGGWDAHLARGGEEWASAGDMGFLRFSAEVVAYLNADEIPPLPADNGLLNQQLYEWLRLKLHTDRVFHLHWPALKHNHVFWDEGDNAHHPPEQRRTVGRTG